MVPDPAGMAANDFLKNMHLLFIAPNPPSVGRAGGTTILYNYLKNLATRHRVDLVTFQRADETVPAEIEQLLNRVISFKDPARHTNALNSLKGLILGSPLAVSHYTSREVQNGVFNRISHTAYDAVICQLTSTIQFLPRPISCATVLMIEDPQSVKFRNTPPWPQHLLGHAMTNFEISRIEQYERRFWKDFDRVVMLNPLDIQMCQKLYPQVQFSWLPYGIDADYFAPRADVTYERDSIIFSGQMNHPPNVEAIIYFCKEIFPFVVAQRPMAQLWIVGANPTAEVQALGKQDPRIHITGFVQDMRDFLLRATVSVCPVRLSYGSRTKVLEAMACGVPVVTLSDANTGIGGVPDKHLLVADTPTDFAASVLKLLGDSEFRQTISVQARQFIEAERSWSVLAVQLEQLLDDLVKAKVALNATR